MYIQAATRKYQTIHNHTHCDLRSLSSNCHTHRQSKRKQNVILRGTQSLLFLIWLFLILLTASLRCASQTKLLIFHERPSLYLLATHFLAAGTNCSTPSNELSITYDQHLLGLAPPASADSLTTKYAGEGYATVFIEKQCMCHAHKPYPQT